MPGAGKSTISKLISHHTDFKHIEFDVTDKYVTDFEHIVFDSWNETTDDVEVTLKEFEGFQKTIIYLNTDKDICKHNIFKRGRATVEIEDVNLDYNFNQLMKEYQFDFLQINNYKLNIGNSLCNTDSLLFETLVNILKNNGY